MAFIGKNVLENLTTAMYDNLLIVYREYIQNSADSIDNAIKQGLIERNKAEINIDIDSSHGYISIEDNGTGINASDFQKIMSSIGDSSKDPTENKGFRGIGRLGGISACSQLRFSCSAVGEDVQSIVIWDAQKLRKIYDVKNQNTELSKLVDSVTEYSTQPYNRNQHFFKVEIFDVEKNASELLDYNKVKSYIRSTAPLPYINSFIFANKIHDFAKEHGFIIDEYNVFVNNEQLYKEYKTKLYEDKEEKNGQKKSYDEISDVKFEIFKNSQDEVLAWMWYGISRFEKAIPDCNEMKYIRLRKNNIQIGDERTFSKHDFYKEKRGDSYFVGEVFAVHSDLRPNGRRDYFNTNNCCREFERQLRDLFFEYFCSLYRKANEFKKACQKKQEFEKTKEEYHQKQEKGFDSPEDFKFYQEKIEELQEAVSKADKTIEKRESKKSKDDVVSKVYNAIKKEYNVPITKKSTDSELKTNSSSEESRNFSKEKIKYKSQNLTQYTPQEQELISKIYGIIRSILPHDTADVVIDKIQEELSK